MAPRNKKQPGEAAQKPTKSRQNRAAVPLPDDELGSAVSDNDDSPGEEQDEMG